VSAFPGRQTDLRVFASIGGVEAQLAPPQDQVLKSGTIMQETPARQVISTAEGASFLRRKVAGTVVYSGDSSRA
jgi:ribonuclease BN (tRNA processing enzyme)